MILTDREIGLALDKGQIILDPRPSFEAISSTSIDLTLAREGIQWKQGGLIVPPGSRSFDYSHLENLQEKISFGANGFQLAPKSFVLGWTHEVIQLPVESRLAARVEGKSSLARIGVGIHITAPVIHAGFKGSIQLEMFNFGPYTVQLTEGMKICQLVFEMTLGTPSKGYSGQFLDQGQS